MSAIHTWKVNGKFHNIRLSSVTNITTKIIETKTPDSEPAFNTEIKVYFEGCLQPMITENVIVDDLTEKALINLMGDWKSWTELLESVDVIGAID